MCYMERVSDQNVGRSSKEAASGLVGPHATPCQIAPNKHPPPLLIESSIPMCCHCFAATTHLMWLVAGCWSEQLHNSVVIVQLSLCPCHLLGCCKRIFDRQPSNGILTDMFHLDVRSDKIFCPLCVASLWAGPEQHVLCLGAGRSSTVGLMVAFSLVPGPTFSYHPLALIAWF